MKKLSRGNPYKKKQRYTKKKQRHTKEKQRLTKKKQRHTKKKQSTCKQLKGGESELPQVEEYINGKGKRKLTVDEEDSLKKLKDEINEINEDTDWYNRKGIKNHILTKQLNGEEGCYSKYGYPVCNIHNNKEVCEGKRDDVRVSCEWQDEKKTSRWKKSNLNRIRKQSGNKFIGSNKEINSTTGKLLHGVALAPIMALPGGLPLAAVAAPLLSKVIQFGEQIKTPPVLNETHDFNGYSDFDTYHKGVKLFGEKLYKLLQKKHKDLNLAMI